MISIALVLFAFAGPAVETRQSVLGTKEEAALCATVAAAAAGLPDITDAQRADANTVSARWDGRFRTLAGYGADDDGALFAPEMDDARSIVAGYTKTQFGAGLTFCARNVPPA